MGQNHLSKKLGIKPGQQLLVINAPPHYIQEPGELPEGSGISTIPQGVFDFVQLFVRDRADVEQHATSAMQALKPGGLLWFAYPPKSSGVKTETSSNETASESSVNCSL